MAKKVYVGAEDNYIQSSGTQWIDTGITPNQDFGFELDFIPLENPVSSSAPAYINAGGAGGNTGTNLRVAINVFTATTTPNGEIQLGDSKVDNQLTVGVRQTISLKNKVVTFPDGTTTTLTTNNFTSPNTLVIFGAHMTTGATVQRMSKMKLFRLKLFDGNTLIKDFVPAYNNSQICLYDNISETYFYNQGTGSFTGVIGTKARNVTKMYVGHSDTGYTPIEYIESSGTQYIDFPLSITNDSDLEFEIDVQTNEDPTMLKYICGGTNPNITGFNASIFCLGYGESIYYGYQWRCGDPPSYNDGLPSRVKDFNRHYIELKWSNAPIKNFYVDGNLSVSGRVLGSMVMTVNNFSVFTKDADTNTCISAKLYGMKLIESGSIVFDLIPVLDDNNVACLFDKVSNQFYYNLGTGTFSAGQVIAPRVTINGVARKIVKGYVGDSNGVARQFFG